MNFSEFSVFRERVLRDRDGVRDAAETNLYTALASLISAASPLPERLVHRCHLASEWVERFGFPAEAARRALISCGVRDSLGRLFHHYAAVGATVWLPEDNYPVYHDLAWAAGLRPQTFRTLPEPAWPDAAAVDAPEILLVTNPMKPRGRWLAEGDVAALADWLGASPRRRVLLDAVYTFENGFHASTLKLLETGQVTLLHSLTKGWLQPRLFGVTLVPEEDAPALVPVFRQAPPAQSSLARAREMMAQHADLPAVIAGRLASAQARLRAELSVGSFAPLVVDAPGYFTPVQKPWGELLEGHQILGIPATAFGSAREDFTILSSLTFLR